MRRIAQNLSVSRKAKARRLCCKSTARAAVRNKNKNSVLGADNSQLVGRKGCAPPPNYPNQKFVLNSSSGFYYRGPKQSISVGRSSYAKKLRSERTMVRELANMPLITNFKQLRFTYWRVIAALASIFRNPKAWAIDWLLVREAESNLYSMMLWHRWKRSGVSQPWANRLRIGGPKLQTTDYYL